MSHALKNNTLWQPNASLENIRLRANLLMQIRQFFAARDVLEVETPLLSQHTVTDPHIESFRVENYYLQTSPEYAMKRLLAAGSGCIFQICKAFRQSESGRSHNPEFSLLEWYRVGFDHHALMNELDDLIQLLLNTKPAARISYQQLFQSTLNINPFTMDVNDLRRSITQKQQLNFDVNSLDKDDCLHYLLSHLIEPSLGFEAPVFIYDFPSSQAALAKLRREKDFVVGERFELYIKGVEIANGFHELGDSNQQRARFEYNQMYRSKHQLTIPTIDERLLAALEQGFPDCAGVAVGLDRLLMLMTESNQIQDVICFDWERA